MNVLVVHTPTGDWYFADRAQSSTVSVQMAKCTEFLHKLVPRWPSHRPAIAQRESAQMDNATGKHFHSISRLCTVRVDNRLATVGL